MFDSLDIAVCQLFGEEMEAKKVMKTSGPTTPFSAPSKFESIDREPLQSNQW